MTTITELPRDVLLKISPYSSQELRYTRHNASALPNYLRELAVLLLGDRFTATHLEAMNLAADRYQSLANNSNPTLARVCRRFRAVFSLKSDAALKTEIGKLISNLLRRNEGWNFLLSCIGYGFYLETLRYYFSLHPEQLKALFPGLIDRVLHGCTPIKFVSDLLKLNDIHRLGLLDRTDQGIIHAMDRLYQNNLWNHAVARRQPLIELFGDKIHQQLVPALSNRCILQEPATELLAALPSDMWSKIVTSYPPLIEDIEPSPFEHGEMRYASRLFASLHYMPPLMRASKRFRTIFFHKHEKTIEKIEKVIGTLLRIKCDQQKILNHIKNGLYLSTLGFYFSQHPEEIEILFSRIIQSFVDGNTPPKFMSSLLALVPFEKKLDGITPAEYLASTLEVYSQAQIDRAKVLKQLMEKKMDPRALQEAEQRRRMRIRQQYIFGAEVAGGAVAMCIAARLLTTVAQNFLRFKR